MPMSAIQSFKRLLISEEIASTSQASYLLDLATADALPVHFVPEAAINTDVLAQRGGTLIAQARPSIGWITPADHGSLAVRPGEHYIHPAIGCLSKCSYCYLLARPEGRLPLRLHLRIEELISAIEELACDAHSELLFCTGELADSLGDAQLWPAAAILARRFSQKDLGFLELRTKSDQVETLIPVHHNGRTTVAFSLAPESHISRYEPVTASLDQRLAAAKAVAECGYPVAFKCEPVIADVGWEEAYLAMFAQVVASVQSTSIDHVSVGCLRWSQELSQHPVFKKKHGEDVAAGTLIKYRPDKFNGTLEYEQRLAIYVKIRQMMNQVGLTAPIWWSLEEPRLLEELKEN
jgi:DNA repair photolyase